MCTRQRLAWLAIGLTLATAACSSRTPSGRPTAPAGGGVTTPAGGGATTPADTGANSYEGNLTTSGRYAATWAPPPNTEADPLNSVTNLELTSDKQTYGHIRVMSDGSISFGSGAPELGSDGEFTGAGARVTLDPSGTYVCAFTVDTDLKGSRTNAVLHLSGTLTVHWHPEGLGDAHCP